ncbi:MAG: hypothetical protein HYW70_02710 [Candidatus Nealsonbacteria bacterium]|nr:hypothetical protein [Candidatus Nealsonbacteria bacterium]
MPIWIDGAEFRSYRETGPDDKMVDGYNSLRELQCAFKDITRRYGLPATNWYVVIRLELARSYDFEVWVKQGSQEPSKKRKQEAVGLLA